LNLDAFLTRGEPRWAELETLVKRSGGRAERLGPDGVRRLGALYRAAAADLALARRRFARDASRTRLEQLVPRARQVVYGAGSRRGSLRHFVSRGYWRRVRERPVALAIGALMLFGPMAAAAIWALGDPGAAIGLVPEEFRAAADPRLGGREVPVDQQAQLAGAVFTNNVRVTLLAFAGGIAVGLGTAAVVIYNGTFVGAIVGLAVGAGHGRELIELVAAHGVLELSCVVVAAAAGLRLGWSIVEPGTRTRTRSLTTEARKTIEIVIGTAPWLVLAGLVEGFVTPRAIGPGGALAVGVPLAALYWSLVLWRGAPERRQAEAAPAPDLDVGEPLTAAPAPSR
jgi:uncharacterized membrane protein SpoIIM required for sporulation